MNKIIKTATVNSIKETPKHEVYVLCRFFDLGQQLRMLHSDFFRQLKISTSFHNIFTDSGVPRVGFGVFKPPPEIPKF
jgi:hypothetical protein